MILFFLDPHICFLQLRNFLLMHFTFLNQLRVLLLMGLYLRLKDLDIILRKLQLRLSLPEIVVLLINLCEDIISILVKTLEPLYLVLQLLGLHIRGAIGLLRAVVCGTTLVILLQLLDMLL